MSRVSLQLHLRRPLEERFDGAALNPSQMANMNLMEIERIQLRGEKCDSLLSDLFDIEGEPCDRV